MPKPGVNGAQFEALKNMTIVLTGTFPEVGGGSGLMLGKKKVAQICVTFGARVVERMSSIINILLVGEQPGTQKILDAQSNPNTIVMTLQVTFLNA